MKMQTKLFGFLSLLITFVVIGCEKEANAPLVPGGPIISAKTQHPIESNDLDQIPVGLMDKSSDRQTPKTDFGSRSSKSVMQQEDQKFSTLSN